MIYLSNQIHDGTSHTFFKTAKMKDISYHWGRTEQIHDAINGGVSCQEDQIVFMHDLSWQFPSIHYLYQTYNQQQQRPTFLSALIHVSADEFQNGPFNEILLSCSYIISHLG